MKQALGQASEEDVGPLVSGCGQYSLYKPSTPSFKSNNALSLCVIILVIIMACLHVACNSPNPCVYVFLVILC